MLPKIFRSIRPLEGIMRDLRARGPWYISDWTDGLNYRILPATLYMYFANIFPAIIFAQDMFDRTNSAYGVNEVLLASAMGGIIFGVFAGQPLCIVGVTGPIAIFNYTVYQIVEPKGIPYFPFMAWICIWSFVMHTLIAVFNGVKYMKYATKFSCDLFACFITIVYIQKGIETLIRQFEHSSLEASYFSIIIALVFFLFGFLFDCVGNFSPLFHPTVRKFISDYSLTLCVVFFTGFSFFPGRISDLELLRLNVAPAFQPTTTSAGRNHGWFIHFWEIDVGHVFLAIPFALLLTALFYFDHNISSIICQAPTFKLRKPSAFHWDFFLLGVVTLVSGFLGLPAPNGLIPQAPLHTTSLTTHKVDEKGRRHVVEQRVSNTTQGLMILGTMTGPLLKVLSLVPQGVLAGLFFMMGVTGLASTEMARRVGLIFKEKSKRNPTEPIYQVRPKPLFWYMVLSAVGVAAEVAITSTIAAVGFPGILMLFMVVGVFLPKIFPVEDIVILDAPAADPEIMDTLDPDGRMPPITELVTQ